MDDQFFTNDSNISNKIIVNNNDDQKITIVYPPTVDWYFLHQRPQQLLKSFSKIDGVRSIFITNDVFKPLPIPVVQLNKDLFIVKPNVDFKHLIVGKKVFWFSYPYHYRYALNSNYDFVVFDAIDNPVDEFAVWSQDLKESIEISNIVSCTADIMYQNHIKSGKPVFMCPNGADYDHFAPAQQKLPKPVDFPNFNPKEKIIGFYGAMASWVDFQLIEKIANKYKVVLIGNNKYYNKDIKHKNIVTLEHKDYDELPFYLSNFDLTIIPFKLTEMIKGCDPIKFYEFISAGKPVLATEMVELKRFDDITYFINHENWEFVIEQAISEDNLEKREARIKVAQQNSWDARASKAVEMIRQHLFK